MSLIDPKVDIVFKNVFRSESIMISFLNTLLKKEEDPIRTIVYLDKEIIPKRTNILPDNNNNDNNNNNNTNDDDNNNKKKDKIELPKKIKNVGKSENMDLFLQAYYQYIVPYNLKNKNVEVINENDDIPMVVETKKGELINIEMQVGNTGDMGKRSLYYASNIISRSLPRSEKYEEIPNLVMINIINYEINFKSYITDEHFEKNEGRCHSIYRLKEDNSNLPEIFENALTIHFLDLKKFEKNVEELNKKEYRWIKFLINPNDDCFKNDNKEFQEAKNILIELGNNDEFYALYKKKVKDRVDMININFQIRKEGKEEGIEEGIKRGKEEGIEEGDKKRKYKVCEIMLNNNEDIERIAMYTELTVEEITQYQESIRRRRLN